MQRNASLLTVIARVVFIIITGTFEDGERGCVQAFVLRRELWIDGILHSVDNPGQTRVDKDNFKTDTTVSPYDFRGGSFKINRGFLQFEKNELEMSPKTRRWKRHTYRSQKDLLGKQQRSFTADYGVIVMLGEEVASLNLSTDDVVQQIKKGFSKVLDWPYNNIRVEKINFSGNILELSFLKRQHGGTTNILEPVPAKQIISHPGLLEGLQKLVPELKIRLITQEHEIIMDVDSPFWMQSYFPYVVSIGSVIIVFLIGIVVYLCYCHSEKGHFDLEDKTDGQNFQHQNQQHVLYPAATPDTCQPLAIQPCSAPIFVPIGYTTTTTVPAQPFRIKGKGLLERRGSNASLTLDLTPSPEMGRWEGTPPKENTGLEYLMSAGNRLSRRDLKNAVKNIKILYEEFWEIPMNHPEKVMVAGSGMKNRYKTIIPNEHSRVILPDVDKDPLSSYINANYIRGYEGEPKAYIATQGPMAHTIVDFWNMVWNENCPIIVMITKLKEKNKPKCENYLPDHHSVYGDIEVTIAKIIHKKGYVVRHLHLKHKSESKIVLHYWYTAWPDHKPPDSPSMLLELVNEVELRRFKPDGITPRGPVLVHCSAGIGRTGCFVAISTGIRQLREEHSVDILGIVCSMRLDRGGMIQTHEQYDFVHQALCEYEHTLGEPSIQSLTALTSE